MKFIGGEKSSPLLLGSAARNLDVHISGFSPTWSVQGKTAPSLTWIPARYVQRLTVKQDKAVPMCPGGSLLPLELKRGGGSAGSMCPPPPGEGGPSGLPLEACLQWSQSQRTL